MEASIQRRKAMQVEENKLTLKIDEEDAKWQDSNRQKLKKKPSWIDKSSEFLDQALTSSISEACT